MSLQQIQVPQIMDSFSKTMNVILAKMIGSQHDFLHKGYINGRLYHEL